MKCRGGDGLHLVSQCLMLFFTLGLQLLPVLVSAQDDADKPVPLSPYAKSMQVRTVGIVALGGALFLAWYWLRRWQLANAKPVGAPKND